MLLFIGFASISKAQPPNNAIFSGGNNDGFNQMAFSQPSNNIFTGGSGDGWNKLSFTQPSDNIFKGGIKDGWARDSFNQPVVNIFNGGNDDGWSIVKYSQEGNPIFGGGIGDGWNFQLSGSTDNSIFIGGIGDGWSSTYRPMGPLPVTLAYFTAAKMDESSAILKWSYSGQMDASSFEIERSGDAILFLNIGKVMPPENSSNMAESHFTDNNPIKGINYYRLKIIDKDGRITFSPSRMVRFANEMNYVIKLYPNPTTGLVNISLPAESLNDYKVINITNVAGVVMDQIKIAANGNALITLNLSRYPKGIYMIHLKSRLVNSAQKIVLQ